MKQLDEVEKAKAEQKDKPTKKNPPRASMTDPEARFMWMPDEAIAQRTTCTLGRGHAKPCGRGSGGDQRGQRRGPRRADARTGGQQRSDNEVEEQLVDGGFAKLEAIDEATADDNSAIYMRMPKPRKAGTDPHQPKRTDSPAVGDWRQRMATPQAKEIYKQRAATIETVNGELKTARDGLIPGTGASRKGGALCSGA